MHEVNPQLVHAITQGVLAAMSAPAETASADGSASQPTPRATIHPPAGICTGDYSKFIELKQSATKRPSDEAAKKDRRAPRRLADVAQPPSRQATNKPTPPTPVPLTGFITAQQLDDASPDHMILVAPAARLTPLARDWVKDHPGRVIRVNADTGEHAPRPLETPRNWLGWADADTPLARKLLGLPGSPLALIPAASDEPVAAVRRLAAAVGTGAAAGGVLLVTSAAATVCYVNRCTSLRGIVGTCEEAVRRGIHDLAANVLILEYPHLSDPSIHDMVKTITQTNPKPSQTLQNHLHALAHS